MELLLILSALLSALTGAMSGVRAPEVRSHHAAIEANAARVSAPATARIASLAFVQVPPALVAAAIPPVAGMAFAIDPAIPLFAERRRE